jgi:hypothetical protein
MPETIETHGRTLTVYDLSQRLSNSTSDFQPNSHHIDYVDADSTAAMTGTLFGMGPDYWPDGKGPSPRSRSSSTRGAGAGGFIARRCSRSTGQDR